MCHLIRRNPGRWCQSLRAARRQLRFDSVRAGADPVSVQSVGPPADIRYARSGDVHIAYQVIGDGPPDLVFVMGWLSHLEYFWREPRFARFL